MRWNETNGTGGNVQHLAAYRPARSGDGMIHAEIRGLYDYWERLRAGRPCPYRAEVDPRDMTGDVRHLFVLEDLGEGNIRFRLAGSALLDAFGYDLRGMSARSIMAGPARESLIALISETLAETGVGYARLTGPDGDSLWEILLLPLRDNFGQVQRLIGCLHPVSGRVPEPGTQALRFTIADMSIQPVGTDPRKFSADLGDAQPLAGFAEGQAPFRGADQSLTAIEGGLASAERAGAPGRPRLRLVKSDRED